MGTQSDCPFPPHPFSPLCLPNGFASGASASSLIDPWHPAPLVPPLHPDSLHSRSSRWKQKLHSSCFFYQRGEKKNKTRWFVFIHSFSHYWTLWSGAESRRERGGERPCVLTAVASAHPGHLCGFQCRDVSAEGKRWKAGSGLDLEEGPGEMRGDAVSLSTLSAFNLCSCR